jgi:hypothetical protein
MARTTDIAGATDLGISADFFRIISDATPLAHLDHVARFIAHADRNLI